MHASSDRFGMCWLHVQGRLLLLKNFTPCMCCLIICCSEGLAYPMAPADFQGGLGFSQHDPAGGVLLAQLDESSAALNGGSYHLCIAALTPGILSRIGNSIQAQVHSRRCCPI